MPKKNYLVRLSAQERQELSALVRKGKRKVAAAKRSHAQILLKSDCGEDGPNWTDAQIATAFDVHRNTVGNLRKRCVEEGLEAAVNRRKADNPRVARKFDGAQEAKLIALRCGSAPEGRAKWTLRLLADKVVELGIVESVSHECVRSVLKKTNSDLT